MKRKPTMRIFMIVIVMIHTLILLAACNQTQPARPATQATTQATTEAATECTEATEDVVYEGEASSYYIDVVYAQQLERYYTAISQRWDENAYNEHEMSALAAHYYEGNPLDNVGFAFMDLNGDGIWELVIGGTQDPLVFD